MTNIEIAKQLLTSFSTGNTEIAQKYLTTDYIQHNLAFATGRDNFVAAINGLEQAPVKTTFENVRAFADGDYVVLQSLYNFAGAGDQIGFDVFRFENGLIAEHWDNLTNIEGNTPSGHTQFDGPTVVSELENTENNKHLVSNFVRDVLRGENPDAITNYFAGDDYLQHNIAIADGLSGLGSAMAEMAAQGVAMVYDRTFKILGQGNFVLAMSEGTFAGKHVAFYDLFRVEDAKIAEHWDIVAEIPAESDWANSNGKF